MALRWNDVLVAYDGRSDAAPVLGRFSGNIVSSFTWSDLLQAIAD